MRGRGGSKGKSQTPQKRKRLFLCWTSSAFTMAASPALPIIAVCGATGKQGGGVINSLLKDAPDTFAHG